LLAHVDMDAFYASVEVMDQPELEGKPVIVGGGKRGVVSAASYAARKFGVRSAMPIFQAKRLCPGGIFVPVRMERYREKSREVMEVLRSFTPVVEQVSVDEAFLDLTGTEGLWGPPKETGLAIKKRMLRDTGLTCSVGIAPLRYLCKIASERDKPDGLTVVSDVDAFLKTVELKEVSGVGAKAQARMKAMGITMLIQLRALGRERMNDTMGAWGLRLWDLANGIDPHGVGGKRDTKSLSHEITLGEDTSDRDYLASLLLNLCQKVCRRLRRHGLWGKVAVLKLRHADHRLVTRRVSLSRPTDRAGELFPAARQLLNDYGPPGPFRLIGVGLSGLSPLGSGQEELFGRGDDHRHKALSRAEDAICSRFGSGAISRAGALGTLDRELSHRHNQDKGGSSKKQD
jgi:DNA polymerase-4